MTGIVEMFADLDGRDLYECAIERWAAWTRARIAATNYEHVKRWRKQNPEKFRAQRKRNLKVWAERYPEKLRAQDAVSGSASRSDARELAQEQYDIPAVPAMQTGRRREGRGVTQKHYLIIVADGPLMILRVPWPMPRWRSILRASTAVMRSHGLRQKDIVSLDGLVAYPSERTAEDRSLVARVDAGYEGAKDKVSDFWLYDWRRDAFKLVRAATEVA